ncbi:MAG: type II 3-dehydroquinate dehydratase [Eubacteriales bacterium]|nr:type II 3-dehydroquinate dehydratase [Eubacteriales bacterium]
MRVIIINGPNINMLGIREVDIYGREDYNYLINTIKTHAKELNVDVEFFQSNHEGAIVDKIQELYENIDGIIINPAAYTHTSIAILDALKTINVPTVEVHITNISDREEFRKKSYIRDFCKKSIIGKGINGYIEALDFLVENFNNNKQ